MTASAPRSTVAVVGSPIDRLTWDGIVDRLTGWARRRESRVVCICNVHSVVTARLDPGFGHVLATADTNTPDGAPVAWTVGRKTGLPQARINGPDLMWRYLASAPGDANAIYLYGGAPPVLDALIARIGREFPHVRIAGHRAPPFRPATKAELDADIAAINASGANIIWVSLGCPKQERWMTAQRGRVHAVMVGVGAAFDYHAGTLARAPLWMQRSGLEWLYRLIQEPRRLFSRYATTNSLFVWYSLTDRFRRR